MKKVFLAVIALFVLSANQVFAYNLNNISDDAKVVSALQVLENIGAADVFDRLEKSSTKVMFYDLTLMSYSYAKHYAISSTDENGNNYILINEKFKNSPKEAIACLIAHESVHQLSQATLDEETRATTREAQCWLQLKDRVDVSCSDDLLNRLNRLAMLYHNSTPGQDLIKISISNNSFYQQQLALR